MLKFYWRVFCDNLTWSLKIKQNVLYWKSKKIRIWVFDFEVNLHIFQFAWDTIDKFWGILRNELFFHENKKFTKMGQNDFIERVLWLIKKKTNELFLES